MHKTSSWSKNWYLAPISLVLLFSLLKFWLDVKCFFILICYQIHEGEMKVMRKQWPKAKARDRILLTLRKLTLKIIAQSWSWKNIGNVWDTPAELTKYLSTLVLIMSGLKKYFLNSLNQLESNWICQFGKSASQKWQWNIRWHDDHPPQGSAGFLIAFILVHSCCFSFILRKFFPHIFETHFTDWTFKYLSPNLCIDFSGMFRAKRISSFSKTIEVKTFSSSPFRWHRLTPWRHQCSDTR